MSGGSDAPHAWHECGGELRAMALGDPLGLAGRRVGEAHSVSQADEQSLDSERTGTRL